MVLGHWASASHIFGGEITYQYISKAANEDVTYKVRLALYLDCKNGNPTSIAQDATALINVFDAKTGTLIKALCTFISSQSPVRVSANNYNCIKSFPDVCVDMYVYEKNMVLPKRTNGYIITFERCCRNDIISNINNPGNRGATYWTEIKPESVTGKNSSPVFKSRPPIFLCLNAPFNFNHSATDADGDSLVYELFTPYIGGSTNRSRPDYNNNGQLPTFPLTGTRLVQWVSPYSENDQMGGNPILEVDASSGKLTVTPTSIGQFVMGILVKEYRKGVLIGETKRDYQFNVANCVFEVISVFNTLNPITKTATRSFCNNSSVLFNNQSTGALTYRWDFGDPSTNKDTSNLKTPSYFYANAGTYKAILIAKSTICADTFEYTITVKNKFAVNLGRDTIFCNKASLTLDAGNPGKQYLWNMGVNSQTVTVNKTGVYFVAVYDDPCVISDTISVIIDESTFNAGRDSTQCNNSFIPFTYYTLSGYKAYLWNTGSKSNSVFIPGTGKYWVTVTNNNNCTRTDTIAVYHFVPPKNFLRDTTVCIGDTGLFDATHLNYAYLWSTGETSRVKKAIVTGRYFVAITNGLCTSWDTAELFNYYPGVEIGRDTFFCGPFSYVIKTNKPFSAYDWNDETTLRQATISKPGKVKVTVTTQEGCTESDSLNIVNFPQNISFIEGDTVACVASLVMLKASLNENYLWNTGETSPFILTQDAGILSVIVSDSNRCMDTVYHTLKRDPNAMPNEIYMPNAFTPSGDKLNEVFPNNQFGDIQAYYNLMVFNRWGEKMFETDKPGNNWDGTLQGKLCQSGAYMYTLHYIGCDNKRHVINGQFILLR